MSKFEYKEIKTIIKNGLRHYEISSTKSYPSITTILGCTTSEEKKESLENWRTSIGTKKADKYTAKCAERGTMVHLMIEQYLKGQVVQDVQDLVQQNMFNSMKLSLNKIDNVYAQEVALYSDILEVAGRTDCVGTFKGIESIIDFKTSTRSKSKYNIDDYWLQCCFYSLAHNEMFATEITQGVIIMGVERSLTHVFIQDLDQYIEPLCERIDQCYGRL